MKEYSAVTLDITLWDLAGDCVEQMVLGVGLIPHAQVSWTAYLSLKGDLCDNNSAGIAIKHTSQAM